MKNLIDAGMQDSNIFAHMPRFEEIVYQGFLEGNVRKYQATREGQPCTFLVLNVIRKDEDIIWGGFKDLLNRSVADAAAAVRGVYIYDVHTMDIHHEVKTYKHQEITTMLLNHCRKAQIGEERLFKYSSVYGILKKLNAVDWGKITFKTAVEIFKDKDCYLDLLVKKLLKNFEFARDPGILLLNDLSQSPIYDAQDEMQKKRLNKVIEKQIPTSIDFIPEVYIQDKNGLRELLSGSIIV